MDPKGFKKIAVVGATTNPEKYGYKIVKHLAAKGYEVYPINPKYQDIDGIKCYKSVSDLPSDVELIVFVVPPEAGIEIAKEAVARGFKRLWFQPDTDSPEIRDYVNSLEGVEASFDVCIMFATSSK